MIKNPQAWVKVASVNIAKSEVAVKVEGFEFKPKNNLKIHAGKLSMPTNVEVLDSNKTAYSLSLTWSAVSNADYYEIAFNGMRYTTIKSTHFSFENLQPETDYNFKIRAINKDG